MIEGKQPLVRFFFVQERRHIHPWDELQGLFPKRYYCSWLNGYPFSLLSKERNRNAVYAREGSKGQRRLWAENNG